MAEARYEGGGTSIGSGNVGNPVKSKGQKDLVDACPYGAIVWNEEKDIPQHWIFDAHLLDEGWAEPRAAQVCATAAIKAVKIEDEQMQVKARIEKLEELAPGFGTKPRVWYKNLHRFTKCFIGGSVEVEGDGIVDCVEGATVVLSQNGETVAETTTDVYGDFKFDDLAPDSGDYQVDVMAPDYGSKVLQAKLGQSVYLGEIRL